MNNNIKKLIALISAASMAFSIAPMAFAEGDAAEDTAVEEAVVEDTASEAEFGVSEYTPVNGVYYDEDFSSLASGTLVTLISGKNVNTEYEESNGLTFSMGSRTQGGTDNYISATDGMLKFCNARYLNAGRDPKMSLSRTTGITIENNLVINADLKFASGNAQNYVTFTDSANNEYQYNIPDTMYADQTINLTIVLGDDTDIVMARVNDEVVDLQYTDTKLIDLASIYLDDVKASTVYLDNLKVTDTEYLLPNDIVFSRVKGELDILKNNENVSANGDKYDIIGGFNLPTTSIEGVNVKWNVYRKAAGSSVLEPTDFLSVVSNSSVTVDFNKDFGSYTAVLVAAIEYNGETTTAEYEINLPAAQTVIDNVVASFDIAAGNTGIKFNSVTGLYDVTRNFLVPSSSAVAVSWQAYQAPKGTGEYVASDIVTINSSNTTKITIPDGTDISTLDIKLVAYLTLKDASKTIEYPLNITCGTTGDEQICYDQDFSGIDAGTIVSCSTNTLNTSYSDMGFTFECGARSGGGGESFGITSALTEETGTAKTLTFIMSNYVAATRQAPTMTLTKSKDRDFSNGVFISMDLAFTAVSNNFLITDSKGTEFALSLDAAETALADKLLRWNIISRDDVTTAVAYLNGKPVKVISQSVGLKNVAAMGLKTGAATNAIMLQNLYIADSLYTVPGDDMLTFVKERLDILEGNENVFENGDTYDIIGGFNLPTATVEGVDVKWDVYQKAAGSSDLEPTEFLSVVDNSSVTIDLNKEFGSYTAVLVATIEYNGKTTTAEYEINLPTVQNIVDNVAAAVDITAGNTGIKLNGEKYDVTKNFVVPSSSLVDISWQAYQAPKGTGEYVASDIVTINSSNTTKITIPDGTDISALDIKLVAYLTLKDASKTIEYPLNILCGTTGNESIYYDQNFSGFAAGTIVACDGDTSNTSYSDMGFTFACGARSDGGGDQFGITSALTEETGTAKTLTFIMSNYASSSRQAPTMTLTKSRGKEFSSGLFISMNLAFSAVSNNFQITDSNGTVFVLSLDSAETALAGKNLRWDIVSKGGTTTAVAYLNGEPVKVMKDAVALKNVATMGIQTNVTTNAISLQTLYIADSSYTIPDSDILATEISSFDPSSASNITKTTVNGKTVYTVDSIRDLSMPTLVNTTVSWSAQQRPVGGTNADWTSTSFLVPSGNTIVINPTSDITDYELKLVAVFGYGAASETREYTIVLPNPMDELNTALASGYEKVTSADDSTKTIDLANAPTLKSDITLPSSVSGCRNVSISWTSSDADHVKINGSNAEIYTVDFEAHEVTLTAAVTYKKGLISYTENVNFPVTVQFTEEDKASEDTALDKYKVRFDTGYAENFSNIPTNATASIKLPTKGYFGSSINWLSSAPTVISNSGVYSKPSAAKNVILTATVMSGAASSTKDFTVKVAGSSSTSGGGGGGGGSTSSTGTVSKPSTGGSIANSNTTTSIPNKQTGSEIVDKLLEEKNEAENMFSDLGTVAWARDAINTLAEKGIINGKTETTFAPNDNITRAEFAKMLMGTFGLTTSVYTTSSFSDVSADAWYFASVETAYNLGIINGTGHGLFNPNAQISRQEMAVMVQRAAAVSGKTPTAVQEAVSFADDADIADYAKEAVAQLNAAGIINGVSDTTFAPRANATRAQAAKILYSFL